MIQNWRKLTHYGYILTYVAQGLIDIGPYWTDLEFYDSELERAGLLLTGLVLLRSR